MKLDCGLFLILHYCISSLLRIVISCSTPFTICHLSVERPLTQQQQQQQICLHYSPYLLFITPSHVTHVTLRFAIPVVDAGCCPQQQRLCLL